MTSALNADVIMIEMVTLTFANNPTMKASGMSGRDRPYILHPGGWGGGGDNSSIKMPGCVCLGSEVYPF